MIPVELISGLITIEDLPARAIDAENDSHVIYGARWWKKRCWYKLVCRWRYGRRYCYKRRVCRGRRRYKY